MAQFLKHVGKHGDRKVAVVYRQVPGEPHMCLVVYTELLNRSVHDPLVQCIESNVGQTSESLADALSRTYTTDGKIILYTLHENGQLKKVQTEQVVMTPSPNTKIKLSELNSILDEMEKGEAAVERLAEIDSERGMQDPATVAARKIRNSERLAESQLPPVTPMAAPQAGALDDSSIANNLRAQAIRMATEAKSLLSEADRLISEASQLDPAKPVAALNGNLATEKRGRGRPKGPSKSIAG